MKLKPFNCIVFATKTTIIGTKLEVVPDIVGMIILAEKRSDAEEKALSQYKSYSVKFDYDVVSVWSVGLRSEKILELLEGDILELALAKMEAFDELDAEIIE